MVRSFADQVASCLHHRQWLEVQARSKHPLSLLHMKSVFVTGYALCLFPTSCVYSDLQDYSCLHRAGSGPLPACLGLLLPAPHEVGVCHRLCPVSFSNFVCLFGFARLLVPVPSRLRASSCLSRPCSCLLLPVQAASCPPAPHEVGVCHRLCPVSFPDFVCLSEAEAAPAPASCPV